MEILPQNQEEMIKIKNSVTKVNALDKLICRLDIVKKRF